MLGLTDIQFDIIGLCILSDDHTAVNLFTRSDEESSTILSGEKTVSNSFTCLECDEGSLFSVLDISLILIVSVKDGIQDTVTFCSGQEFLTKSDQSSGRDGEFETVSIRH